MTGESVTFCTLLETRCQQQLKKVHSEDGDLNRMEKELDSVQNVGVTASAAKQSFYVYLLQLLNQSDAYLYSKTQPSYLS